MTWLLASQVMIHILKDVKSHKNVESEKGIIISGLQSLLEQIQRLLSKMEQLKSCCNMTYGVSPRPFVYVDSGSEVHRAEHESWPMGFPCFYFLIYNRNTYRVNLKKKNSFWKLFVKAIPCKWKYNINPRFCDQSGQNNIVFASLMERPNQ